MVTAVTTISSVFLISKSTYAMHSCGSLSLFNLVSAQQQCEYDITTSSIKRHYWARKTMRFPLFLTQDPHYITILCHGRLDCVFTILFFHLIMVHCHNDYYSFMPLSLPFYVIIAFFFFLLSRVSWREIVSQLGFQQLIEVRNYSIIIC